MGSLRGLVLLASLTACETSGIRVDVILPEGGAAPDHVRLFVGVPAEDAKATIGPEMFNATRAGSRWVRDPMDYDDILEVEPGGDLSFGFVTDGDQAELGAVIAVGYTNSEPTSAGSLFRIKTGVGVVRVFQLQLFPAVNPRFEANRNARVQVEVWGPEDGDEACVHLWNKHPDRDMTDPRDSAFIVSKDNRDCDRWGDTDPLECSADVHENHSSAPPKDIDCALYASTMVGSSECVLGGPACIDGAAGANMQCAPTRYCAPPSVCGECGGLDGDAARDCIRAPFDKVSASSNAMYGLKCYASREIEPNNPGGPGKLCSTPLSIPLPPMAPLQCSNALIAAVGAGLDSRVQIDDMRFEVEVTPGCTLTLKPSGLVSPTVPLYGQFHGLVTADLDNGRSIALPLEIQLGQPVSDCSAGNSVCVYVGDNTTDSPFACAGVPESML